MRKASEIASYILWNFGNGEISSIKLQHLIYICHGYCMAKYEGEPLIEEEICAWRYGPTIPIIHREYGEIMYRPESIPMPAFKEILVIIEVLDIYLEDSYKKLVNLLISDPLSPNQITLLLSGDERLPVIDNGLIYRHFHKALRHPDKVDGL